MAWKTLGIAIASLSLLSLTAACGDDAGTGGAGSGTTSATTSGAGGAGGGAGGGGYSFTTVKGFNFPESCYWDAASQVWYVSNIAPPASGDILEEDGEGWISRLDQDGNLMEAQWVTGLDTPAGMRAHNGILYVANINDVVGFNVSDGSVAEVYNFPAALLLNDPAVDATTGDVYISDTLGHVMYMFHIGSVGIGDVFLDSPDLLGPNGVLVDGGKLVVASMMDFNADTTGPLLTVALGNGMILPLGDLKGKLDGIEKDGDEYLVSDNPTARIYRVAADGTATLAYDLTTEGLVTAADIGFDPVRRMLCIPDLQNNTVSFLTMQ